MTGALLQEVSFPDLASDKQSTDFSSATSKVDVSSEIHDPSKDPIMELIDSYPLNSTVDMSLSLTQNELLGWYSLITATTIIAEFLNYYIRNRHPVDTSDLFLG